MKTIEIEVALMEHFDFRQKYIVPNITNISMLSNFEIDLLVLTKSGYATGVEIKVSKADLKKDFEKRRFKVIEKHPMMFDRYYGNLKHFYYAVPEKLKDYALEMIPDFAGLLIAKTYPESYNPHKIHIKEIKSPSILNKTKWNDKMIHDLLRLGTMRIYNLKKKLI